MTIYSNLNVVICIILSVKNFNSKYRTFWLYLVKAFVVIYSNLFSLLFLVKLSYKIMTIEKQWNILFYYFSGLCQSKDKRTQKRQNFINFISVMSLQWPATPMKAAQISFARLNIFRFATVWRTLPFHQRMLNAQQGSLHLNFKLLTSLKIEIIRNFKKDITIVLEDITAIWLMITVDQTQLFAILTLISTNQQKSAQIINWTVCPFKTIF